MQLSFMFFIGKGNWGNVETTKLVFNIFDVPENFEIVGKFTKMALNLSDGEIMGNSSASSSVAFMVQVRAGVRITYSS